MRNNKIFQKIDNLLDEIVQKNNFLEKEGDNISQIDIDIIKSEIRSLYQLYSQLSAVSFQQSADSNQQSAISSQQPAVSIKPSAVSPKQPAVKEDENKVTIKSKQETVIIEETTEEVEEPITNIEEQKAESKEQTATSDLFTDTETVTISEKYKDNKKSINDKIGINKTDESIADKLKSKHTDDIKASIGINEKFLFINELFEGDMSEYNEFIAKLNNQNNLEGAHSFINEQKSARKWKDNLDSLNKLTELVESRYS